MPVRARVTHKAMGMLGGNQDNRCQESQPHPVQVSPAHTRCHPDAALSHHFLDAFQSYHLGLCNRINDVFGSKFVQV